MKLITLLANLCVLTVTRFGQFSHTFEDISRKQDESKWRKKMTVGKVSERRREK
jgi:hypothetical protein